MSLTLDWHAQKSLWACLWDCRGLAWVGKQNGQRNLGDTWCCQQEKRALSSALKNSSRIQGDTSGCGEPTIDIITKVLFLPGHARTGQAKTEFCFDVNGRFATAWCVTLYDIAQIHSVVVNLNPYHIHNLLIHLAVQLPYQYLHKFHSEYSQLVCVAAQKGHAIHPILGTFLSMVQTSPLTVTPSGREKSDTESKCRSNCIIFIHEGGSHSKRGSLYCNISVPLRIHLICYLMQYLSSTQNTVRNVWVAAQKRVAKSPQWGMLSTWNMNPLLPRKTHEE